MNSNDTARDCDYKSGSLPSCAPLGLAYVPMQQSAQPAYEADMALTRGTLFPGLDLPFMNIVNKMPGATTPMRELQALDFMLDELELYLDTHKNDAEAFAMWKAAAPLAKEAHEKYAAMYGPICQSDMISAASYTWLKSPWPWEYDAGTEG